MAPHPRNHPFARNAARPRPVAVTPVGRAPVPVAATPTATPATTAETPPAASARPRRRPVGGGESGSMTTEYGLLVVVGATCTGLVIKWASGGAIFELLGGVLNAAKSLVGF